MRRQKEAISVIGGTLIVLLIIGLIVEPILTLFLFVLIVLIAAACFGGGRPWRKGRRW